MKGRLRSDGVFVAAALGAIVALGAFLRFYDLAFRGFIYWDEAKFALEGIRIEAGLQSLFGGHVYILAGKSIGTAKPTHALFLALGYLLFGVHDYVAAGLNALAATLSLVLVFVIARRLFNVPVALIAALLLAVSEYDAIYARSALSESDATFLFLAAFAVWCLKALPRDADATYSLMGDRGMPTRRRSGRYNPYLVVFLAGLLLGIAFTTNYRVSVYAALLVVVDLVLHRRSGVLAVVRRALTWIGSGLIAPVVWQVVDLVTHANGLILFGDELGSGWRSYFSQVLYQLHEGKQSTFHFEPVLYLQWFAVRQGWWQLILLAVALVVAVVKRHEPRWSIPALFVAVPYVIYVFAPFTVPRSLVTALPFAMILIAGLLAKCAVWLVRLFRRHDARLAGTAFLAAALVIAGLSAPMTWRLTAERSGFVQAVRYVEKRTGHVMTSSEIVLFYMRGSGASCNAPALPLTPGGLATYVKDGYSLAILERHHSSQIAHFVRTRAIRVGHFPALGPLRVGEDLISSENSNPPSNDYVTEYVDVYRFSRVPAKPDPNVQVSCTRDHVT